MTSARIYITNLVRPWESIDTRIKVLLEGNVLAISHFNPTLFEPTHYGRNWDSYSIGVYVGHYWEFNRVEKIEQGRGSVVNSDYFGAWHRFSLAPKVAS